MAEQSDSSLTEVEQLKIDRAHERLQRLNYYEILNLPRSADRSQIKRNYYTVSKEFHPDRYFRRNLGEYKERLEGIFDLITRAYNTLIDEGARAAYDRGLIEEDQRTSQPGYEVSFDLGGTPTQVSAMSVSAPAARVASGAPAGGSSGRAASERAAPGRAGSGGAGSGGAVSGGAVSGGASREGGGGVSATPPPGARPAFMDKLQSQFAGRIQKGREYLKLGKEAVEKGQFVQAAAHLQLAISFDPRNEEARVLLEQASARVAEVRAESYYQRGLQEEMVGSLDNAIQHFRMAVDCKPKKGQYYFKLGTLEMLHEESRRQGVEHLKQAALVEPNKLEYLLSLARAYDTMAMPRNAMREFERVLALDKGHDEAVKAVKRLKQAV